MIVAVPGSILLAVLLVAVISDSKARRIPNVLIVAGWVAAIFWHLYAPIGNWAFDPTHPGGVGLLGAIAGLLSLLLIFLPFYVLRIMGAGDVKLMSVVGAFFGSTQDAWIQIFGVSLFVLASGGLLALMRILGGRNSALVLANLRLMLAGSVARTLRLPGPAFDARTDSADRMPYAVAIAMGTILYLVAKWAGWMTVL